MVRGKDLIAGKRGLFYGISRIRCRTKTKSLSAQERGTITTGKNQF